MTDRRGPDRREFLGIGIGAFAVALLPGALRPERSLVRRTVPSMGTVAELGVVARDGRAAHRALDAAVSELRRVEALMTRFRPDSDIGRVNLGAARAPVPVSLETAEVVRDALRWARWSEGRFDPALGRATELWDPPGRSSPPPAGRVAPLAGRELWRAVEVETTGSVPRIRLHDPDARLDLGGIAKGRGVDLAARALTRHGHFDGLVNVGGDLRVLGLSPDRDLWSVGVRAPDDPSGTVATLRLRDTGLATSGDYLRFFEHGGRRYHHLLDPADAVPRRSAMRSVTVVAEACSDADAAATATFGLDPERAGALLERSGIRARIAHTA